MYSYKIQKCYHCKKDYIAGTSEDLRCNPCRRKGHALDRNKCAVCFGLTEEGKDPLANLDDIINNMKRRTG